MSIWKNHVLPQGELTQLTPELWQVTGSLDRNPSSRNMQISKVPSGGLLMYTGSGFFTSYRGLLVELNR